MPDIKDIRGRLGMMYNNKIAQTKLTNPEINSTELKPEEIENLQVSVKTKNRPFTVFYEFLDPSNGTTFCQYDLKSDPFAGHDFTNPIPNPLTRKHAQSDPSYKLFFPPRVFKR